MAPKALDLFQAYSEGKLPKDGGYIVSSFFSSNSTYSRYEIVAYDNVKSIYESGDGLTFQTDGNKLFVLVEPPIYPRKHIEPLARDRDEQIPHRFSELEIFSAKNQVKVMVSKTPIMTYSAFTILKPTGINFSLIFYNRHDVIETLQFFFKETLHKEAGVPKPESKQAAELITKGLGKFNIWVTS